MSQADELLNSLTDDEIAVYTADRNTEEHIVIGEDRFITVPESLKRIAVQYDHNIETVTFDCPRYWDGHDMSKMAVYINYRLPNGVMGGYIAENITVDSGNTNKMHFTWTVSNAVTAYKGNISFLVCIKKTDGEGNETNHWNSELCRDIYVSEGLETEVEFAELYSDMLTQLLLRMTAVEQINIQADTMQKLYRDTVEVGTTAVEAANQAESVRTEVVELSNDIKTTYANAIKGTAKGDIVRVDDVSPVEHVVKAKVHGKNLFNVFAVPTQLENEYGSYISAVGDGYIDITSIKTYDGNGHTATPIKLRELCPQMRAGKQYILAATSGAWNKCIYLSGIDYFWQFGSSIIVTEEMLNCTVGFYGYAPYRGQEYGICRVSDIQIEEGSIVTAYEPYVDPSTVTVTACGKNVLELSGTKSQNGVTMTVSDDGLVTIKGTTTATINLNVGMGFLKAGYKYKPTIRLIKGDTYPSYWSFKAQANMYKDKDGYISSDVDTEFSAFVYAAAAGTSYDGAFRIMVELVNDDTGDTFDKGSSATYTPATDGSVDITSVSPTITVFTDTPGVIVDLEYNRDTTKAMTSYIFTEEIKNEIAAKVEGDMEAVLVALNSYVESLIGGDS